ncbi:hypothetical protein SELMODRAFT_160700 [Selaginella moellendorffii]|uniref:beta-aspartyl-peptidase n=1 Tax=Selaginella moellendorffii TaxID=88036 RepID=D8T3N6_SELML|nr:isoaspartyl peptidase/L-asparaginase 1 [Selaginella moellendorffii]EFJ08732.1 hypothetical protein SELMODRAFT_160700 [Selaginella moellendorffii]|eukprot:XP_002990172.1 isoaspartyl peptidase/L-asparaginase 1 [Selaginella moellendorffii]
MGWALALHGGAGDIKRSERTEAAESVLLECLSLGVAELESGRCALDVVELVVRALENNEMFNAGKGSVLTAEGTVEMEASIMDGATGDCGAVSGLTTVVNPISLARLVMEKTPHIYLAFDGAEAFARQQGVETADPGYFVTERNIQRLRQTKETQTVQIDYSVPSEAGETVGCVAVDCHGKCAAATSTGGMVNKMAGRIGDTPVIGAGTYANGVCAVSTTGKGESIMRGMVAADVAARMKYKALKLSEAAGSVVKELEAGTTGLVAVSAKGEIAMDFNTTGMFRASADHTGHLEVGVW